MATSKSTKTTSTTKAVTTQGTKTAAGVVNYNPNTGAKLKAGESVTVNAGGNTYGSNQSRSYDSQYTSGSPTNPQVNAENINTKAMNVPPPPVGENYMGTLLGANTGLDNQALGTTTDKNGTVTVTPVEPTAQADGGLGDIFKQYQELSNTLQKDAPSAESIYNKSLKESGLRQYQQEAQNYSSQINAITAKAQADMLSTTGQGRGIPEAIIGGQQAQISKEAAIQALPLQALLANAQGNVELAQSHLDTLFKIRFEDAKTKHEYKTKLLDNAMLVATKKEERQYEAIKLADARKYAEETKNADMIKEIAFSAMKNGAPASFINSLYSAKTFNDAIAIKGLSNYMTSAADKLDLELKRAQIGATNRSNQPDAPMSTSTKYTLVEGDDPYDIAQNAGITVAQLKAANMGVKDWNNIKPGATLNIPNGAVDYSDKQVKVITKLNQDVSTNATYKKTTSMKGYADNVNASLAQGSGVGDIAAINQFQKVIDEGAVTRDQDVKLIQGAQSLQNTLKTRMKKLEKGEQLSPELRAQMIKTVNDLYNSQVKALNKDPYIQAKNREAQLYGLNTNDTILGELSAFTVGDSSTDNYLDTLAIPSLQKIYQQSMNPVTNYSSTFTR